MDEGVPGDVADDALLGGRVRLRQLRRGHRVGTDAVLLAAAVEPQTGEVVADIGAGTGAVGLMIAARAIGVSVVFVERDPVLLDLCRANAGLNGITERASTVEADVLASAGERRRAGLIPSSADWVATNRLTSTRPARAARRTCAAPKRMRCPRPMGWSAGSMPAPTF